MKKLDCRSTLIRAITLTKFQQRNVVRMVWEVLVDNHFADPDMFPVENDKNKNKKGKGGFQRKFHLRSSRSLLRSWSPRMTEMAFAGKSSSV